MRGIPLSTVSKALKFKLASCSFHVQAYGLRRRASLRPFGQISSAKSQCKSYTGYDVWEDFRCVFGGSNRASSRNGLKFGLLGHVWSIYGEFFKPGLLVTVPGPTVDENDPTPFRHRGGLISNPPGGGGGRRGV